MYRKRGRKIKIVLETVNVKKWEKKKYKEGRREMWKRKRTKKIFLSTH